MSLFAVKFQEMLLQTPGLFEELDAFYKKLSAFLLVAHTDDGTLSGTQFRCRVTKDAAQTMANGVATAITFTAEDYDVGNMHDSVSNTSRVTVPSGGAGGYLVQAGGTWDANSTGFRVMVIRKNGASINGGGQQISGATVLNATVLVTAVAGDFFELYVTQSSGGNLDFFASALSVLQVW